MTDFIQRLQKLEETRKQYIAEKNRLEASISIQEELLNEFKKDLEAKGIVYDSLDELQADILEREKVLEEKVSNIENRTNNTEVVNTETVSIEPKLSVNNQSDSLSLNLDIDM